MSKLQISLMDCPCNLTNLSSKVCMRCCASIIVGKNEIRAQKWKIRANRKSRTTKNDEVSGLMNIFKLQNPLFEQVNTKKKCTFIFNSNSPNSVQNVQMCPNCQIRPKNVEILSNLKKPKTFSINSRGCSVFQDFKLVLKLIF